jgi:cytochrome c peroxidase
MAAVFARTALRSAPSTFRTTTTRNGSRFAPAARQAFRQQSRRGYADAAAPKSGGSGWIIGLLGVAAIGGGGYYYSQNYLGTDSNVKSGPFVPKFEDYQSVYNAVAKALEEKDDYDDGSYGPVLLRLAWHASGTYVMGQSIQFNVGITDRFIAITRTQTLVVPMAPPCDSHQKATMAQMQV